VVGVLEITGSAASLVVTGLFLAGLWAGVAHLVIRCAESLPRAARI